MCRSDITGPIAGWISGGICVRWRADFELEDDIRVSTLSRYPEGFLQWRRPVLMRMRSGSFWKEAPEKCAGSVCFVPDSRGREAENGSDCEAEPYACQCGPGGSPGAGAAGGVQKEAGNKGGRTSGGYAD